MISEKIFKTEKSRTDFRKRNSLRKSQTLISIDSTYACTYLCAMQLRNKFSPVVVTYI